MGEQAEEEEEEEEEMGDDGEVEEEEEEHEWIELTNELGKAEQEDKVFYFSSFLFFFSFFLLFFSGIHSRCSTFVLSHNYPQNKQEIEMEAEEFAEQLKQREKDEGFFPCRPFPFLLYLILFLFLSFFFFLTVDDFEFPDEVEAPEEVPSSSFPSPTRFSPSLLLLLLSFHRKLPLIDLSNTGG